jgi:hypothetical protein
MREISTFSLLNVGEDVLKGKKNCFFLKIVIKF